MELSISYISDWAVEPGVFVDDATAPGEQTHDFESGLGAWTVPGPPAGSGAHANDWTASGTVFSEGATVSTENTHYFGFGVEA